MEYLPWMKDVPCAKEDPELFFSKDGEAKARSVCKSCPVQAECLAHAQQYSDDWGIWADTDGRERRKMRRNQDGIQTNRNVGRTTLRSAS